MGSGSCVRIVGDADPFFVGVVPAAADEVEVGGGGVGTDLSELIEELILHESKFVVAGGVINEDFKAAAVEGIKAGVFLEGFGQDLLPGLGEVAEFSLSGVHASSQKGVQGLREGAGQRSCSETLFGDAFELSRVPGSHGYTVTGMRT